MAKALHDHAVDEALADWVAGRRLVGVMGGHALERGTDGYRDAARLGRLLGAGHVVATGGGPGAMEAANLGAYLAGSLHRTTWTRRSPCWPPSRRSGPRSTTGCAPPSPCASGSPAAPTRSASRPGSTGTSRPTCSPTPSPSTCATRVRESVLLEVCHAGIVFLPGRAGTVQEVFQDACENYYADESSVAPMVLVGRTYWTETVPAWPLLETLARGRPMEPHVHLVDDVDAAAELFGS